MSELALRIRFQNGMVVTWHGRGMACVNQTRPHYVNQMGKTQSKPLAARHGMCQLALIIQLNDCTHDLSIDGPVIIRAYKIEAAIAQLIHGFYD
jgi:hypothetical protein